MSVPSWWEALLLALATYRVWRLLAEDTILDRPRDWLLSRSAVLDAMVPCVWCLGTWVGLAWWGAWQAFPHGTLVAAGACAVLTGAALVHRLG